MPAIVKLNSSGIQEVLQSPEVEALLIKFAEPIAARARANAPVDTGEYQDSIEVVVDHHSDRVVVHVTSTAPHGMIVESKTGNLARALGG